MDASKLGYFEEHVPNWHWTGTAYAGTCPLCGSESVSGKIISPTEIEVTCRRCGSAALLNAIRDLLKSANGNLNGNKVVSVVAKTAPENNKVVSVVPESHVQPPAELEPEALYGLMGEVVLTIEPHTESHPAAILGSLIASSGCMLYKRRWVYRDGARHHANEFIALVGPTGSGRKGTATRRVDEVFLSLYDCKYTKEMTCHVGAQDERHEYEEIILKGLGSGEALIEALADDSTPRRRLVFEEEMSRALKVMRREGSILSETLRQAWDGGTLSNRTKGRQLIATNTHVCVLAHVTPEELRKEMATVDVMNGFGNRFLWFWTESHKSLPFGGGEVPIAKVVSRLNETLQIARDVHPMEFDEQARRMWDNEENDGGGIYKALKERPQGLFGAITTRSTAHVTRLAMLYAVMDAEKEIRVPHLLAALAVWDYNERTCRYLFGDSSGHDMADTIEELLLEAHPGYLTRKEIRDYFQRNARPGSIPLALETLKKQGKAEVRKLPSHRGPKAEAWTATGKKSNDLNDLIPLEKARRLVQEWDLRL